MTFISYYEMAIYRDFILNIFYPIYSVNNLHKVSTNKDNLIRIKSVIKIIKLKINNLYNFMFSNEQFRCYNRSKE